MPRYGICQRARLNTGSGMDDHAGGFVDDGEVFVFVDDVERNVFGFETGGGFFGQVDVDLVVCPQFV